MTSASQRHRDCGETVTGIVGSRQGSRAPCEQHETEAGQGQGVGRGNAEGGVRCCASDMPSALLSVMPISPGESDPRPQDSFPDTPNWALSLL